MNNSAVQSFDRQATPPRSLSNWAMVSVVVGVLSAFAALGVVISEYYITPDHHAPVAVAPELPVPPALDLPLSPIANIPLSPTP